MQPKHIRNPAGGYTLDSSCCAVHARARGRVVEYTSEVDETHAEEYAAQAAAQRAAFVAGGVQRRVPLFEHQPLLRVHCRHLGA